MTFSYSSWLKVGWSCSLDAECLLGCRSSCWCFKVHACLLSGLCSCFQTAEQPWTDHSVGLRVWKNAPFSKKVLKSAFLSLKTEAVHLCTSTDNSTAVIQFYNIYYTIYWANETLDKNSFVYLHQTFRKCVLRHDDRKTDRKQSPVCFSDTGLTDSNRHTEISPIY